jgi:hypothetical protein
MVALIVVANPLRQSIDHPHKKLPGHIWAEFPPFWARSVDFGGIPGNLQVPGNYFGPGARRSGHGGSDPTAGARPAYPPRNPDRARRRPSPKQVPKVKASNLQAGQHRDRPAGKTR